MNGVNMFDWAAAAMSAGLGLATLFRTRQSPTTWTFTAGMLILSAEAGLNALSRNAALPTDLNDLQRWRLTVAALLPSAWVLFSLNYARARGARRSPTQRLAVASAIACPILLALSFQEALVKQVVQTVDGHAWNVQLGWAGAAISILVLVSAIWVVLNVERTYRASVGTMRWRIKFLLLGVAVLFVTRIYTSRQALLFNGLDSTLESVNSAALLVGSAVMLRSLFRSGHFDLEVYPSQSVLQNSFTFLIAGAYLLIVGIFAKVVTHFGGDRAFPAKAFFVLVALVGLAIALQSDRAKLWLRQFVSRHFHRSPYDYRKIWKAYTEATATCVAQDDLCRVLVRLSADTFQALSVSLWLLNDEQRSLVLAAATGPAPKTAPSTDESSAAVAELRTFFSRHVEPFPIETAPQPWAAYLRELHPSQFAHGGSRICIPILRQSELLGVLLLGDRIGGAPFTVEDFDMLRCVADQAAASLLNVQLSKRLLQGKELEAFQTMATFFVHDLKNAASTLNLMLQNLPVHYNNPEFRADALRGIGKTVSHINHLTSRLASIRHELKVNLAPVDLNRVVEEAVGGLEKIEGFRLIKELPSKTLVMGDREHLLKVITNFALNAKEACPVANGEVRVSAEQNKGWVVLRIADNGCGMSQEFISRSLFRPFQTTKKNGLGIGMFQSKMIIEAHGGKISVTSETGRGTTFQIFLRAAESDR
jgi:putative PEP-CTERM system histidine kinase